MPLPRLRFTVRRMMVAVAAWASSPLGGLKVNGGGSDFKNLPWITYSIPPSETIGAEGQNGNGMNECGENTSSPPATPGFPSLPTRQSQNDCLRPCDSRRVAHPDVVVNYTPRPGVAPDAAPSPSVHYASDDDRRGGRGGCLWRVHACGTLPGNISLSQKQDHPRRTTKSFLGIDHSPYENGGKICPCLPSPLVARRA